MEGPLLVPSLDAYNMIGTSLRNEIQRGNQSYEEVQDALLKTDFGQAYANLLLKGTLHLAPDSETTRGFVSFMSDTMNSFNDMSIKIHANEDVAVDYILDHLNERTFALVVLDRIEDKSIKYTLRFNSTLVPNTNLVINDFTLGLGTDYQQYLISGFMPLQSMINDYAFNSTNVSSYEDCRVPRPFFMPFPTPAYDANPFFLRVGFLLGLAMVMSTLYPISRLAKSIVEEKEIKMRELLKISGVKDWIHHFTWFIHGFILFFWIAVTSSRLSSSSYMPKSDTGIVFMFFFLFSMSEITLAFLISVFFSNAKLAAIAAPVVLFCSILPRFAFVGTNAYEGATYKYLACLLSPTAFAFGAQIISDYEYADVGVNFVNIDNGEFSLLGVMQMLTVDIFIYAFLAWYFDLILPGEYGTSRHPLFFLSCKYWASFVYSFDCRDNQIPIGSNNNSMVDDTSLLPPEMNDTSVPENIEPLTSIQKQHVKIVIRNVRKEYANKKVAVQNLSVAMCESQVTCLLGHNGAGKSTTMSILTGLTPSSSGSVNIYGYDIANSLEDIRSLTGICMQQDVLYPSLTVYEHLMMFGNIRGLSCHTLRVAVDSIMASVFLVEKKHVAAASLSGGMKRKLCLAIALIGDPKFLVLDEPTSGLDPYSRRAIWDLIQKKKQGRVIMLSTHFMDEADLLGDRIAILSDGQIRCSGSSLYLKTRFGAGYVLSLSLENQQRQQLQEQVQRKLLDETDTGIQFRNHNNHSIIMSSGGEHQLVCVNKISDLIGSIVPGARLRSNVAGEIMYTLPLDSMDKFATLFKEFEKPQRKQELGIVNFGVTITSLEQIFVALAKERNDLIDSGKITDIHAKDAGCYENMMKTLCCRKEGNNSNTGLPIDYVDVHADIEMADMQYIDDDLQQGATEEITIDSNNHQEDEAQVKVHEWTRTKIQLRELLRKRYVVMSRDQKGFFFQVIFPVLQVILILAILTIQYNPSGRKMKMSTAEFSKNFQVGILDGDEITSATTEWLTSSIVKDSHLINIYARTYDLGLNSSQNLSQTLHSYLDPLIEPAYTYEYEDEYFVVGRYKRRYGAYVFGDEITTYIDVDLSELLNGTNTSVLNTTALLQGNISIFTIAESIENQVNDAFAVNINATSLLIQAINNSDTNLTIANLTLPELISIVGGPRINITTQIPSEVTIMHNSTCPHATVMFQNDLIGEVFKTCGNQDIDRSSSCGDGYCAFNHPLPVTKQFSIIVKIILSVVAGLFILVPLCYLPAAFVTFLVKERVSKSKHLQLVSGVSPSVYWVSTLIWDYTLYCILVLSIMITLFGYGQSASSTYVNNFSSVFAVFLLLMMYGLAVIPLSYIYSFLFDNYSTAQISITVIHFITGFIFVIAYYITVNIPEVKYIGDSLTYFFWWFPPYNVGQGLLNISANYFFIYLTKKEISYLSWDVTGRNIVFLVLQFVFFFGCVILSETKDLYLKLKALFSWAIRRANNDMGKSDCNDGVDKTDVDNDDDDDDDVIEEMNNVNAVMNSQSMNDYSLLLHHIKKTYGDDAMLPCSTLKRAVRDVSIIL